MPSAYTEQVHTDASLEWEAPDAWPYRHSRVGTARGTKALDPTWLGRGLSCSFTDVSSYSCPHPAVGLQMAWSQPYPL